MSSVRLSSLNNTIQVYTVQLRYKQTTHTHIIHTYFAYMQKSLYAHICTYMSLLFIAISFFILSIVGQTKVISGMKKVSGLKRNLHIV